MIRVATLAAVGLSTLTSSACARQPTLAITPTALSSRQLEILTVYAHDAGDTVNVRGLVARPLALSGGPWGHLHIVAQFFDGRPEVVVDTVWDRISFRGARTGRYAAKLPIVDAAAVSQITVSHAANADATRTLSRIKP